MVAASHEGALPERAATDLDRRRRVFLALAAGSFPATVAMQAMAHAGIVPAAVGWTGISFWFLAFVVAGFRVHDFRCPRCDRRFSPRVEWRRPVCCASCGLPTGPLHPWSFPGGRA